MSDPLAGIAELVRRESGNAVPAGREVMLRAAVARAAPGMDPAAFLREAADPASGRALVDRLIDEVTVQETGFLRDRGQLDAIDWPGLWQRARAAGSGVIRAWSVGCATGEEAYSLALLAAEALAAVPAPVDVLGTDISLAALAAASAARYPERSVRALTGTLRQRYLGTQPDGSFLVGRGLRDRVRFRRHNLVRDPVPPPGETGFDLVICRNVLIYFDTPVVGWVTGLLREAVLPGGALILGAADALHQTAASRAAAAAQAAGGAGPGGPVAAGETGDPGAGAREAAAGGAAAAEAAAGTGPGPAGRALRRPLGRRPPVSRGQRLTAALDAADAGEAGDALARVAGLLADDPLDADAHLVHGLVSLAAGEAGQAAAELRRALYTDPTLGLAAFALGRAYDALGDTAGARRAYQQALRTLDPADSRHDLILRQVGIGDIEAACRARLGSPA